MSKAIVFNFFVIITVQLWTVNNYHWYLKQQIEFPASLKDRVACFTWDPEADLTLHIMTTGEYLQPKHICLALSIFGIFWGIEGVSDLFGV